jgi:tRNA threonylcarbamoyladenosine biosynthesis protein TsaB
VTTSQARVPQPILILDTSVQGVGVGIMDPATRALVHEALHPENMGSVVAIAGLVERALAAVGSSPAAIAGVAVGVGPGSFTGIKVGLAFAYGLAAAATQPLPLLGASGLEAAARGLAPNGAALMFLQATRTHGFVGVAEPGGATRSLLVDAENESALAALLAGLPHDKQVRIVGEWPLLRQALARHLLEAERMDAADASARSIRGLAAAAALAWPAGFGAALPEPRYLRLSTAEEKLQNPGRSQP